MAQNDISLVLYSSVHYPTDYGFIPETLEKVQTVVQGWGHAGKAVEVIDDCRKRYLSWQEPR